MSIDNWDEYFFRQMYLVASKSKDPSTAIGTVLVRDKICISTGYNGFPRGVKDFKDRYEDRNIKYELVCHSEANSVIQCARIGISTLGAVCYTNAIPCSSCCKILINGGISEIIIHKQWQEAFYESYDNKGQNWEESGKFSRLMLDEAGIPVRIFDQLLGITCLIRGKEIGV